MNIILHSEMMSCFQNNLSICKNVYSITNINGLCQSNVNNNGNVGLIVVVYMRLHVLDSGVLGGWWFGASPSSPDSNFLRVQNAFPNRRLSDNALMTPKIRIAPSCASSPGGTPGGGLPIRRHSSIGPQERRGSAVNLSPPTVSTGISHGWHSTNCGSGKDAKGETLLYVLIKHFVNF